jgi:hypothetical protein
MRDLVVRDLLVLLAFLALLVAAGCAPIGSLPGPDPWACKRYCGGAAHPGAFGAYGGSHGHVR